MPAKPPPLFRISATYSKEDGSSSYRDLLATESLAPKPTISALDLSDLTPEQAALVRDAYAKYQASFREHLKAFPTFASWAQVNSPGTPVAQIKTFRVGGLKDAQVAEV